MNIKSIVFVYILLMMIGVWPVAGYGQGDTEVLTNATIIKLTNAGLGADLIITKIDVSKTDFDVSLDELLRLKKEKVADEVIKTMIGASENGQPAEIEGDPNDPTTPHPPGIYYWQKMDSTQTMTTLYPTVYKQAKSGGFFTSRLTYGIAKVKSKAVLDGKDARLQTTTARPIFYFYFEVTNAGLSNTTGNVFQPTTAAVSPNEFILGILKTKKNSRELTVGQFGTYGVESGPPDKETRPFSFEEMAPGIFKVQPNEELEDGEYCFFYAGATPPPTYGVWGTGGSQKVFDFGIDMKKK